MTNAGNSTGDLEHSADPLSDTASHSTAMGTTEDNDFIRFVNYLTNDIKILCRIQNTVHRETNPESYQNFLADLRSLLEDLGCNFINDIINNMSNNLENNLGEMLLEEFIRSKLMDTWMRQINNPSANDEAPILEPPIIGEIENVLPIVNYVEPPADVNPSTSRATDEEEVRAREREDDEAKMEALNNPTQGANEE